MNVNTMNDDVLSRVASMVSRARDDATLELEARIGRQTDRGFVASVTREHMDGIVRLLDACGDVSSEPPGQWTEEENYIYTHAGRRMRTRVRFPLDTMKLDSSTIVKRTIDSITLKSRVLDVRVTLSAETPVEGDDVPACANTDHVRIKQTRSYRAARSPFRIDCACVWSGDTRGAAEAKQKQSNPVYEIECELDVHDRADRAWARRYGAAAAAARRANSDGASSKLAHSLLLKMADLMMSPGIHFYIHSAE